MVLKPTQPMGYIIWYAAAATYSRLKKTGHKWVRLSRLEQELRPQSINDPQTW